MSLDKCRETLELMETARDAIYRAMEDGLWLDGDTRYHLLEARLEMDQACIAATQELREIETAKRWEKE